MYRRTVELGTRRRYLRSGRCFLGTRRKQTRSTNCRPPREATPMYRNTPRMTGVGMNLGQFGNMYCIICCSS